MIRDILYNIIECSQSLDNYIKLSSLNKDTYKFSKQKNVINKVLSNKNFTNDCVEKIKCYISVCDYYKLEELLKIYQDKSELQNIYINEVIQNKYLRNSMIGKSLIDYLCQILFFNSENINLDFYEISKIDFYLRAATYGKYRNGVSFIYSNIILDNFSDIISSHFINLKNINEDMYYDKFYKFIKDYIHYFTNSNINSQTMSKIFLQIYTVHNKDFDTFLKKEFPEHHDTNSLPENFREVFGNLSIK